MKGRPEVLAELSEMLKAEFASINEYMLHAEMCENWGYERLSKQTKMLHDAGVETFQTNALMALASAIASRKGILDSDVVDKVWNLIIGS